LLTEKDKQLPLLKGAPAEIPEFETTVCVGVEFPALRQDGFQFGISSFCAAVRALDVAPILQPARFASRFGLVTFLA
jgi:hypothetical protein